MGDRSAVVRRPIHGLGQKVAIGAAHAETTNPIGGRDGTITVSGVRLFATVDCFIDISNPQTRVPLAVVDTDMILPAGTVEYFDATGGDKVSVIQLTGAGSLYVMPVA